MVCRILLANSLRKKRYYKETSTVEVLSTDAASHSKKDRYQELLQWDPISSGSEVTCNNLLWSPLKHQKLKKLLTLLASVIDSLPSNGFEIKNILPVNNVLPASSDNKINSPPATKKLNQSATIPNNFTEQSNILDICPEQDENSLSDAITRSYSLSRDHGFEKNIHSGIFDAFNFKEINIPTALDSAFPDEQLLNRRGT